MFAVFALVITRLPLQWFAPTSNDEAMKRLTRMMMIAFALVASVTLLAHALRS